MAVKRNRYYNDPSIGQAFDSLASIFGPPKATDVYAYAKARSERDQAQRLADFYRVMTDPNSTRAQKDSFGIGSGAYKPTDSWEKVYLEDGTKRYGVDVDARTKLDVARMGNNLDWQKFVNGDVSAKQDETVFLSPERQRAMGLGPSVRGNVSLQPGEKVVAPDGGVFQGNEKPLTSDELTARIMSEKPPEQQNAFAMRGVPTQNVVTAEGPRVAYGADAVGQQPYVPDQSKPQLANYKSKDETGTARFDTQKNKWVRAQTGEDLPPDAVTFGATLQGNKDETGLGTSTRNSVESQLLDLALVEDTSKQFRDLIEKNPNSQGIVGMIQGTAQDLVRSANAAGRFFNVNMDKIEKDIADGKVDPEVAQKLMRFDPSIPAAQMMETLLISQVAKMLDPNGRISNDRFEHVASRLGSGWLGNRDKTIATLDTIDQMVKGRRKLLQPSAPNATFGGGQGQGQGGGTRLKFDADGNLIQ